MGLAIGDKDHVIDNATMANTPGAFSNSSAGALDAAIGSANSAYAVGNTRLFAVDNGMDSALYRSWTAQTPLPTTPLPDSCAGRLGTLHPGLPPELSSSVGAPRPTPSLIGQDGLPTVALFQRPMPGLNATSWFTRVIFLWMLFDPGVFYLRSTSDKSNGSTNADEIYSYAGVAGRRNQWIAL
jgi:hypothetical protein